METIPRHQCLVYSGAPNMHLRAVSLVIRGKLEQRHRCVYLNSEPMVAGMRSYLAAAGVDVERARELLDAAGNRVKIAVVMERRAVDATQAQALLEQHGGALRELI